MIFLSKNIKMNSGRANDETKRQDLIKDEKVVDTAQVVQTAENKKQKKVV